MKQKAYRETAIMPWHAFCGFGVWSMLSGEKRGRSVKGNHGLSFFLDTCASCVTVISAIRLTWMFCLAACSGSIHFAGDAATLPDPMSGEGPLDDGVLFEIDADLAGEGMTDFPSESTGGPAPSVDWALHLDGGNDDFIASTMLEAGPDRYVVAGSLINDESMMEDLWVAEVEGEILLWQKVLGGSDYDAASRVVPSENGGMTIVGQSYSFGGHEAYAWVFRTSSEGNVLWHEAAGGGLCPALAAFEDRSGNLVLFGEYLPASAEHDTQACMMKLGPNGGLLIQRSGGGVASDRIVAATELKDGSIAAVGETRSFGTGRLDAWIVKLDSGLNIVWQKTIGGSGFDSAVSVAASDDGGILVAGTLEREPYPHTADIMVIKLASDGDVAFNKLVGGPGSSNAGAVASSRDGGILVAGSTWMADDDTETLVILKLDAEGGLAWQTGFGHGSFFQAVSITESAYGGLAVLANKTTGEYPFSRGAWLIRLEDVGESAGSCSHRREIDVHVQDSEAAPVDSNASLTEEESDSFVPDLSASQLSVRVNRLCPE